MAVPKLRQVQAGGGQDKASIPDSVISVSVTCVQGGTLGAPSLSLGSCAGGGNLRASPGCGKSLIGLRARAARRA